MRYVDEASKDLTDIKGLHSGPAYLLFYFPAKHHNRDLQSKKLRFKISRKKEIVTKVDGPDCSLWKEQPLYRYITSEL